MTQSIFIRIKARDYERLNTVDNVLSSCITGVESGDILNPLQYVSCEVGQIFQAGGVVSAYEGTGLGFGHFNGKMGIRLSEKLKISMRFTSVSRRCRKKLRRFVSSLRSC